MTDDVQLDGDAVPRLARHVRWRDDKARDQKVLMAPERVYVPDAIALDVLQRLDGETTLDELVEDLADEYDAPGEVIAADVRELLTELFDKDLVSL